MDPSSDPSLNFSRHSARSSSPRFPCAARVRTYLHRERGKDRKKGEEEGNHLASRGGTRSRRVSRSPPTDGEPMVKGEEDLLSVEQRTAVNSLSLSLPPSLRSSLCHGGIAYVKFRRGCSRFNTFAPSSPPAPPSRRGRREREGGRGILSQRKLPRSARIRS